MAVEAHSIHAKEGIISPLLCILAIKGISRIISNLANQIIVENKRLKTVVVKIFLYVDELILVVTNKLQFEIM